ncbi:MAG: mannose-6-phosphate isomerase, class I [Winkia neuii]|nr:mannose-6-phosphate isomerase, class I [Winkia neuii]
MLLLEGAKQPYAWGSRNALPALLREPADSTPVAEIWYGSHPIAPTKIVGGGTLEEHICSDPLSALGQDTVDRFGQSLPFLMKYVAPARPLSLQVHPSKEIAVKGYASEEEQGIDRSSPSRSYKDSNHKPEMLMALTDFEAVVGFRAPRKAREILRDLAAPLARSLFDILDHQTNALGMRTIATQLMDPDTCPDEAAVNEVVVACRDRIDRGTTPSKRADTIACELGEEYPGDAGAVLSLLLNPVTLRRGETLFIPCGHIHAYMSGLGLELMAASDNVLRAGLTEKYVDAREALRCTDFSAAPPMRIAPEWVNNWTAVYYAPVDDFELSLAQLGAEWRPLPGRGPRILTCLDGQAVIATKSNELSLQRGHGAFIDASDGTVRVRGHGHLAQVDVP